MPNTRVSPKGQKAKRENERKLYSYYYIHRSKAKLQSNYIKLYSDVHKYAMRPTCVVCRRVCALE